MSRRAWLGMSLAAVFSLGVHLFLLFEVKLGLPDIKNIVPALRPLKVTLVNSRSKTRPEEVDALAQANLDGGGNTAENKQLSSPTPHQNDSQDNADQQSSRHLQQLEEQNRQLMTKLKSTHTVARSNAVKQPEPGDSTGEDLVQRSLEIARLEAQINKDLEAYQKLPRRKFIGARTREFRFAQYVEDWRAKVERVGNLHYPDEARRRRIFGSLQLTVAIRADGSVEDVQINRSSGQRVLDDAALNIVRLAAPFAPLPADIRRDTDILSITRTWTFTPSDQMRSE